MQAKNRSLPPALSIGEWAEERIELRATGPGLSLGLAADRPEGIEREDGVDLFGKNDAVRDWFERCLDLHGARGRSVTAA